MGHGGDELRLELFRLVDLHGHVIDGVNEVPHLVIKFFLHLDAVGAAGDTLSRIRDGGDGLHDGADKVEVGEIHQQHDGRPHQQSHRHDLYHLEITAAQGCDDADDPDQSAVPADNRRRDGHHPLPGVRRSAGPGGLLPLLNGGGDIRRSGIGARDGQVVGGAVNAAGGVEDLELQPVLVGKGAHIVVGGLEVLALGHGPAEKGQGRRHPGLEARLHGGVKVAGHGRRKGRHREEHNEQDSGNTVEHPAPSDPFYLCHLISASFLICVVSFPLYTDQRGSNLRAVPQVQNPHLYP